MRLIRRLPAYHPDAHEPPKESPPGEGVRDTRKPNRAFSPPSRKALGLGGLLATGTDYGLCLAVKANALVRSWTEHLGGAQFLHWIVDAMVKVVPSI